MAYYPYTKIHYSLFILSLINMMQITNAFDLNPKFTVNLKMMILEFVLKPGDQFGFSFRMNIFGTTLFHCNLLWGSKHNHFDVFNQKSSYCSGRKLFKNIYCTWLMKDFDIFLALGHNPSPSDFYFLYPWL
ncbi:hypothetical protein H5410_039735 [Solanum commersonii]|uniref:S-protein homolog n=1 Tax=Solanum commersonii TaxID=4109 RepID=A0A9J5XMZ6_SOLCO|nr:hypothetical protein H5410_039735 [Solanum commersonii]